MKDYFQESYKTYQGTADLYVYFIERGISLIQDNGYFSYIVANKWLRTKYAEPMRVWLKEQGLEEIVDFGDLPVFQGATTYPCIIRIHKSSLKPFFIAAQVQDLKFTNLTDYVETISYKINKDGLEDKGWSLSDEKTQHVLSKLKSDGIPLEKYVNKKVFYGIKTGLNAAFVLSEEEKNTLIESDSRSADLIKPFLIGREVKRYSTPKASSYLILIPRGWTRIQSNNSRNPWEWLYKNYSAIATRLLRFSEKAEKRYDKGEYWWELRACDYYDEF